MTDNEMTGEASLTKETWGTGMVLGIAVFALAYHLGTFDRIIAAWTPANHQGAHVQLDWNLR